MQTKKIHYILLIIFAVFTVVGILFVNFYPTNVIRTTHVVTTDDGVAISYNLYRPATLSQSTGVVIVGHGVIVNKEMMTNFAIELATLGFVVGNIDWRGHGQSTGEMGNMTLDLEAVINDISIRVPFANTSELALLGYSMGGGPTYEYALAHNDTVKAWVGVATSFGMGPVSNLTNPNNVLFIVGDIDEAVNVPELKTQMVNLTGVPSAADVQLEHLYGNITNGTARMVHVVPGADHLVAPWHYDFIMTSTNWITQSLIGVLPTIPMVFQIRNVFNFIAIISLIGVISLTAFILANKLNIRKSEEPISKVNLDSLKDESVLKFVAMYYVSTFVLIPTILFFLPLLLFTPLALTAVLTALVGCLGVNLFIFSYVLSKEHGILLKTTIKKQFSASPKIWILSLIIGITFFFGFYLIFGLNFLGMIPAIPRIPYFFVYIPVFFLVFWFLIFFAQKFSSPFLESKLEGKNPLVTYIIVSLTNFVLLTSWFTILILVACLFMGSFFFAMIIILMVPIFLFTSFFISYMEKLTGSTIPGTVLITIMMSFVLITLTPYITALGLIGFLGGH